MVDTRCEAVVCSRHRHQSSVANSFECVCLSQCEQIFICDYHQVTDVFPAFATSRYSPCWCGTVWWYGRCCGCCQVPTRCGVSRKHFHFLEWLVSRRFVWMVFAPHSTGETYNTPQTPWSTDLQDTFIFPSTPWRRGFFWCLDVEPYHFLKRSSGNRIVHIFWWMYNSAAKRLLLLLCTYEFCSWTWMQKCWFSESRSYR